uniref:Bm13153, isoform b n=1 Tax=Brugia malayi TaxID=6279 RepID=A0A0J9XZG3_BRUMA|nr:Bm13153, isoform b [Brugia malayi]
MKRNHNHGNRLGKQKTLLSFVKSLCNLTTRTEDSVRRGVRLGGTSVNAARGVRKTHTQGSLACGSQAFIATLLFDPSMSALPIIARHWIVYHQPCYLIEGLNGYQYRITLVQYRGARSLTDDLIPGQVVHVNCFLVFNH